MALKLIRRGPETVRLVPDKGTGWKNCLRPGNTSPYMGGVFLAVQATGCDGLRLIDWGGDRPDVEVTTGAVKAAQMVGNTNTVIRVLNPTDKTEVIMHVVPIPPPPCLLAGLRAWWGGCRGAEVDQAAARAGGGHNLRQRVGEFRGGGVAQWVARQLAQTRTTRAGVVSADRGVAGVPTKRLSSRGNLSQDHRRDHRGAGNAHTDRGIRCVAQRRQHENKGHNHSAVAPQGVGC